MDNVERQDLPTKTVLMDASSAIILYKAGIHAVVVEKYKLVMPCSVYEEITTNSYPGAREYRQLLADKKIIIKEPLQDNTINPVKFGINNFDRGECDTIQLYYSDHGDFIITDDGTAAKYCTRKNIPFINALLVPRILEFAQVKDEYFCCELMAKIIGIGRYSPRIISFAKNCKQDDLALFFPE